MKSLRSFLPAAGLLTVNLSGCVLDASDVDAWADAPMTERWADPGGEVEPPAGVCSPVMYIAQRTAGVDCPPVGAHWKGESLFGNGTDWLREDDFTVPAGLSDYCEYTWDDPESPPSVEDVQALHDSSSLDAVSPSCVAITGQADLLSTTLGPLLRDAFHVNAGRPSAADLGLPMVVTTSPTVTVMVVDSQPADFVVPRSRHGLHMGNIISDIACPGGQAGCLAEIEYAVGLPRIGGGGADYVNGGIVAYHRDLAAGIYEGVRRWETNNANRPVQTNLVMNLSVGWEGGIFGGEEADPPPAIAAVRTALEYASCKQAIIVASAGNRGDFCDVDGPMLPALWETYPAPDDVRCAELGVTTAPPAPGYRPLVHAVGGLDINGGAMPRARENADPRLMAPSAHVAAGDPIRAGLTGTSVGTAAVAGAAALVWSYRPGLAPHRVMQWVYAGGEPLDPGFDTDFGLDPNDLDDPRRVDACSALDAACSSPFANCPTLPLGCSSVAFPAPQDVHDALASLDVGQSIVPSLPDVDTSCFDTCGTPVDIHVPSGDSANCEIFDVDPAEHLINPTPDSIACPTCGIQDNYVSVTLDPDYTFDTIDDVQVVVTDDAGNTSRFELGPQTFGSDTLTVITLPLSEMPPGPVRLAEIIIDFDGRRTTIDPLLIQ